MRFLKFILIIFTLAFQAHALEWEKIAVGTGVELTDNLNVNKLLSYSGLQCRAGNHTFWPKFVMGPTAGADGARLRFLTVIEKYTDLVTYRLYLQSEQLPCGCVVWIDQTPEYLRGVGNNFKMLKMADPKTMLAEPSIPTACGNLPDWFNRMTPLDEIDPNEETIAL